VHYNSPRTNGPLVAINCAAIPENLLESELFGHERGAFTDAHARKLGHFESAHKGTIFLDEIGEMNPATQAKLLRVLETGTFSRVGGAQPVTVDVRVVAATNRDLDKSMADGSFRPDLYFRLNVVAIHLPPLRDRREDLPLLIRHFLQRKSTELGLPEKRFSRETTDVLLRYRWPGNVRELENIIERALALSLGSELTLEDLPPHLTAIAADPEPVRAAVSAATTNGGASLADAVDRLELLLITDALTKADHNQTRAAEILGTTRRILKYKMDKLGIVDSEGNELN
jgi:DNA-binding NtrC family response regulator